MSGIVARAGGMCGHRQEKLHEMPRRQKSHGVLEEVEGIDKKSCMKCPEKQWVQQRWRELRALVEKL